MPFESTQYVTLARCTQVIVANYPAITRERIAGHAKIAPDRKTDP